MTIECRETQFGRPVGEPQKIWPGTGHCLEFNLGFKSINSMHAKFIRIRSGNSIEVINVVDRVSFPVSFEREAINEQNLQSSPFLGNLSDLLHWRRKHFYWVEDPKAS
jgi:hypothetical protein